MSMVLPTQSTPATDQWLGHLLARFTRNRRTGLGLTVDEAAELSGMEVSEWLAMEDGGWIPDDRCVIRAIAGTLQVYWTQLETVSVVSRWAQQVA